MIDLDALLSQTSRTFALAIPLLPESTRRDVTLAYLLFRIADTFEDSDRWSVEKRVQALEAFVALLRAPDRHRALELAATCQSEPPTDHAGYRALLAAIPEVLEVYEALSPDRRRVLEKHAERTALGMAGLVRIGSETDGLTLGSIEALRDYCYTVAGIVGELLTDLFVLSDPKLTGLQGYLRARARSFGEALQLVNILKDAEEDARENRRFLPADLPRSEVFDLARADLKLAAEYTEAVQRSGAAPGLVGFLALSVLLSHAAIQRVEEDGPGAKIPRQQVLEIYQALNERIARGAPAIEAATDHRPAA